MTKKEAIREIKKLRRDILAVVKSMTTEMPKEASVANRIKDLTDKGILAVRVNSGVMFYLFCIEDISGYSFRDILLDRREGQKLLTILRATRAVSIQ